jgi:hypothetical protein
LLSICNLYRYDKDNFFQDVFYGLNKEEVIQLLEERRICAEDTEIATKVGGCTS